MDKAIMVKFLAQRHNRQDQDLNPHSTDNKQQSLNPGAFNHLSFKRKATSPYMYLKKKTQKVTASTQIPEQTWFSHPCYRSCRLLVLCNHGSGAQTVIT